MKTRLYYSHDTNTMDVIMGPAEEDTIIKKGKCMTLKLEMEEVLRDILKTRPKEGKNGRDSCGESSGSTSKV